jgi:hypothetical protein
MRVFVGGLWSSVGYKDLDRLVSELLRGPWYKLHVARGKLAKCELLQLTERKSGRTEYCAIIDVQPHRVAWEVVQQLDGAEIHGRILHAHRWFPRLGLAERRANGMHDEREAQSGKDRRAGRDRRRMLEIEPMHRKLIQAVAGFQRSYGS